ncbi:MAG: TrkH family potassium uptake protein [Olsenella sp.]|jgi:trk system potassium uptake protein TrkH
MNYPMIRYVLAWVLKVEGAIMALPCLVALVYHEQTGFAYLLCMLICLTIGFAGTARRPRETEIYTKDGMVTVSLAWLVLSLFGALPFVMTGEIPNYVDAMFEIISGFTTTGASICTDVEALSHATRFWRSFSHWIGGMGVLVFILMMFPVRSGSQMNLMKAESPGYNVSKFVPHVRDTAKILYRIYLAMTVAQIVILLASGMYWFDALCITFGSAGTGGFSVLNDSCASYTPFQQVVTAVFMIAFGVNFSFYYLVTIRRARDAFRMEEVRAYLGIILAAIVLISVNTVGMYASVGECVRAALFQVASIITTTGYSTVDFNLWPALSKEILLLLMCIGACAGSTGGGLKVSRVIIFLRAAKRGIRSYVHPHNVMKVRMDGEPVSEEQVDSVYIFLIIYVFVFALSVLVVSIDGFNFESNFSAVAATLNNIGPGLEVVGPMSNFSAYSYLSKLVLMFDMLAGRLELFPVLVMLDPNVWTKGARKDRKDARARRRATKAVAA